MEPVQLIKEIPENMVVSRFLRRKHYPGSEYFRLSEKGVVPRIYKNMGRFLRAVTTITKEKITITGGGMGRRQNYPKGHIKYEINLCVFDSLEAGKFKGYKECKAEVKDRRYG